MDDLEGMNISIQKCKDIILEYQKTKDPELFKKILEKLDRYLIYVLGVFRRKYFYFLKDENYQDLYHIAILGVQQGILSLPKNWEPSGIYLWVDSYTRMLLKRTFRYKMHEIGGLLNPQKVRGYEKNFFNEEEDIKNKLEESKKYKGVLELIRESEAIKNNFYTKEFYPQMVFEYSKNSPKEKFKKILLSIELSFLLDSGIITKEEKRCLEMFYFEGMTYGQIAEVVGLGSSSGVYNRIKKILKKLKEVIEEEEKN